eukprot:4206013-Ditylum_brightwellii.AAC.2
MAQHVKGHQSGKNLTWEAQLNNMADELATEARDSINPTMLKQMQSGYPKCSHIPRSAEGYGRPFQVEYSHWGEN